jgi:transketolase
MNGNAALDAKTAQDLKDMANKLRILSIKSTSAANSGHPTSCCSAAEITSALFFHVMKFDPAVPRDPNSDRFVMSKGHAAPLLYAAWVETGHVKEEDLMRLRKIDCYLEGHPLPRQDFVDVATGSLGQGLSCAAGMAYTAKHFDKASYRVYCLMGDGEAQEGSVWEAAHFASFYRLDNLVAIVDVNRLGQSQPTSLEHHMEVYQSRFAAFGWEAIVVDGHDINAVCAAFAKAASVKGRPTALLAKTYKGKGIPGIEDEENWHGKPLGAKTEEALTAINGALVNPNIRLVPKPPIKDAAVVGTDYSGVSLSEPPKYAIGDKVATRAAYGTGLVKLATGCNRVIALDGDVKNSTFAEKLKKTYPERFVECFIAEQNLVGVAIGCGTRHRTLPFVSTFATFFTRAADQLRMGALSQANIKCCGSHCGISIGEDGPSQMGLEDIALFRSVAGSTVFYPTDAVSTERAVELAGRTEGICFIRTGRPANPVIYPNEEPFEVGKAKVYRQSPSDKVVIIGAGVTFYEAIKAADSLAAEGINCTLIDPFTIKPIDGATILAQATRVGGRVVVVEDHYAEGGIGEAVSAALSEAPGIRIRRLAVTGLPRSGPGDALLQMFGISGNHVIRAVKGLL